METETKATTTEIKQPTNKPKKATKKPTKKPTAKKVKAATEKKIPVSGQSGPPGDFPFESLNDKEKALVQALNGEGKGTRTIVPIATLAMEVFAGEATSEKVANSWVRNSLRRLVRGGWVEKAERGTYRVTPKGRTRLSKTA